VLAGDDMVPFTLPTDVFDSSHHFSARSLGATKKNPDRTFYTFVGTTSTWLGTGFFNVATSNAPVGIFFYDRKLTERLRFFSREIVANRQTSLHGSGGSRANRSKHPSPEESVLTKNTPLPPSTPRPTSLPSKRAMC
jgi:hypothetical protein